MKKSLILVTLFSLVQIAEATNRFPSLAISDYVSENDSRDCANFTGVWKGKCSDGKEKTVRIDQTSCTSINMDGRTQVFGALQTESLAMPAAVVSELKTASAIAVSSTYDWNSDRSAVEYSASVFFKPLDGVGKPPINALVNGRFHLNDGKLMEESEAVGVKISCSYVK